MANRKNYNSILFLTVYLGLVLVGGSSQVFAHAATNSLFDIRNEIEFKDDLDNKPNNEESESLAENDFSHILAEFLYQLKGEIETNKISFPLPDNFQYGQTFTFSGRHGTGSFFEPKTRLDHIFDDGIKKFQQKAGYFAEYAPLVKTSSVIKCDKQDFLLKVSFSRTNAEQFADFLSQELSSSKINTKDKLLKQVYENTKVTSENNQIFIVTRLPRGSIDSLLK